MDGDGGDDGDRDGGGPIALWLDCDTGHDDAFALLLAARHPRLRLLGISSVYGNAPLQHTTRNTCAVLRAIRRDDVPVYQGAATPFCRLPATAADIHGDSGLDGTTCLPVPHVPPRTDRPAIEAMYAALMAEPPGTAWIVATGCLTNIALLIAVHPDVVSHLAGLSVMGGAVGDGFTSAPLGAVRGEGKRFGNWTPWAEFNIYVDPESAAAVFHTPELANKTTLITLDLTHQFLGTPDVQQMILHGANGLANTSGHHTSPVRTLFFEILTFFATTYADVFGITAGPPLHDPLAVAVTFAPALFDDHGRERFDVRVVTEGEHGAAQHLRSGPSQCGRTVVAQVGAGRKGVRIPRGLNTQRLWKMLDDCLDRVDE